MKTMKRTVAAFLVLIMIVTLAPHLMAAELPFKDVKPDYWFYNNVRRAYETGLVNGKSPTEFRPNDSMTYAEAVKLAVCMHEYHEKQRVTTKNNPTGAWYQSYVTEAENYGIIRRAYDWNKPATRADYVEIFAYALPEASYEAINDISDNEIPDVKITHPAALAIYKLYRAGILTGSDDKGSFMPSQTIKRSEVSAILSRMMDHSLRRELELSPKPLKISSEPSDVTAEKERSAVFNVVVKGGSKPYTYRWETKKGSEQAKEPKGSKFIGQDTNQLTIDKLSISADHNTMVRCVVTDDSGKKLTSKWARLSVVEKLDLRIIKQPENFSKREGEDVKFSLEVAGGKMPYSYEWHQINKSGVDSVPSGGRYKGQNFPEFFIKNLKEAEDNGSTYYCIITDSKGAKVTSNKALLSIGVAKALSIKTQPGHITMQEGDDALFKVEAEGGKKPYTYQWHKVDSSNVDTVISGARYEGSQAAELRIKNISITEDNGMNYYCEIKDGSGAKINSYLAELRVEASLPLTIVTHPYDKIRSEGEELSFFIIVTGGKKPYTYEWHRVTSSDEDTVASGAQFEGQGTDRLKKKNSTYTEDHNTKYYCVVKDAKGAKLASNKAAVTIEEPKAFAIVTQPQNVSVVEKSDAKFNVVVEGGLKPYTYQWYVQDTIPLPTWFKGLNEASMTHIEVEALQNNYAYHCVIKDASGKTLTSDKAYVSVSPKPAPLFFEIQPKDQVTDMFQSVSFSARAINGKTPYQYQWMKGDTVLTENVTFSGVNTEKLTVNSVPSYYHNAAFHCVVTDAEGTKAKSNIAKIRLRSFALRVEAITSNPMWTYYNDSATLEIKASGGEEPYSYQWYKEGTELENTPFITGVKTASLKILKPAGFQGTNKDFYCIVTDVNGVTAKSENITLVIANE